jgi:mannosyltransferase
VPAAMIEVIYNGIRVERFRRIATPAEERKRLGLPPDGPLIGMIGRCSAEKGGATWIQAIAMLARAHVEARGVLVGDGPERAVWQTLAAEEGVSDRIGFVGEQVEIAPWLSVLAVLACPSLQESFGISALEAHAAGVPVVATRVDGFLEVLHDGEDALLVDAESPAALAEAIRAVLWSEELAGSLTAAGLLNAARFSIKRTADHYAGLYGELMGVAHTRERRGARQ